ncbi:MAG TPA: YfhO family protein [Pseudomonadales bacterium]|nr:YfhO family protein [Pseudomonadales bacterium]
MIDTINRLSYWFTPRRFGLLLALMVFASYPQVILGMQTFVARDYGFFAYPLALFQKDTFWRGEIPFWDAFNNCGVPFLAQWNTMPLYPPSLIYLLLPLTWSLSFFCLLHLWFGGVGMYLLARKWTGNDFAGAFAGTTFCFSGLTLNLLMWPSHTATWAWMPWVVMAVESAWCAHACESSRKILIAAICGGLQMLAGGPEIIFFTWLVLLALWIQQLINNDFPRKTFWRFPVMVALVAALAAAQLLPFFDLTAHSQRQSGYADLRWSMPGSGWANFLVPMAFGHVLSEGIFFQDGQYWTSSYYLGFAPLMLALLAFWKVRNGRVWSLGTILVIAVIFALGANTPIFPAIRHVFPQLGFVTYPVKYLLLVTFIAPLLAAFSLAQLRELNAQKSIVAIGIVLLVLLVAVLGWQWKSQADDVDAAMANGIERIPFLVLTAAALYILAQKPKLDFPRTASVILILLAWVDVLTHEPTQNPTVPPYVYEWRLASQKLAMNPPPALRASRAMVSPKAYMEFIQRALQDPAKNFLAKRLGFCGDCNLLDGVPKVDGFFSLTTRENNDLFLLMYQATNEFPHLEDFLGVSQITAPDEIYNWQPRKTFLPLVTIGPKPVFLDDADALRMLTDTHFDASKVVILPPEARTLVAVTNQTTATFTKFYFTGRNMRIRVDVPAPALVVVAETFYHNWHATVDDKEAPIFRANYGFDAIQVPEGLHDIQLVYRDRAFDVGAMISAVAWLGCLVGCRILRPKPE